MGVLQGRGQTCGRGRCEHVETCQRPYLLNGRLLLGRILQLGPTFFSKGQNLLNFHELSMAAMSNICFYITSQVKLITDMVVYTPIINKPKYSVPNQASSSDSNLNFFFSGLQPVDPSGGRFFQSHWLNLCSLGIIITTAFFISLLLL